MMCYLQTCLLFLCYSLLVQAKIMRNNALMSKMITHFQQDNNLSFEQSRGGVEKDSARSFQIQEELSSGTTQFQETNSQTAPQTPHQKAVKILHLMQHVLCKNFPTIPCNLIMQDGELNTLIEQSIMQLSEKKLLSRMALTTQVPVIRSTGYPSVDSEDLSNFLEVSNTGFFDETGQLKSKSKPETVKNVWTHEKPSKQKVKLSKDGKRGTEFYTGKKMRKFYPHKIKYKDKADKAGRTGYKAYQDHDDKMSMSAELPDIPLAMPQAPAAMSYKVEQSDTPVWRIDYMKHGVPSLSNAFSFQGKMVKTGNHKQSDGSSGAQQKTFYRKEVRLHPDLYIKNNYIRKSQR